MSEAEYVAVVGGVVTVVSTGVRMYLKKRLERSATDNDILRGAAELMRETNAEYRKLYAEQKDRLDKLEKDFDICRDKLDRLTAK